MEPLKALGHTVDVLSLEDPPDSKYIKEFPGKAYTCYPRYATFGYCPNLPKWLKKHILEYDAVLVSGLWQYHNVAVRKVARKLKRPYWIFTHGMLDPYFNKTFPLKRMKKYLYWPAQYLALRDAEAALFTCDEERLLARQAFRPYKVVEKVIHYGTSGPKPEPAKQQAAFQSAFPDLNGKRFILFLSRIHPKKGVDLLLHAWKEAAIRDPELHLAIAGPANAGYKESLEKIVRDDASATHVHWLGMLQGDVKWGAFREAEAFVLPSHQENFGIAVSEALACGLPVLITYPVNIWREIEEDGAGLIAHDTQAGIADLLTRWIETPPEKRRAMGEGALRCYSSRFTIEKSAASIAAVLEEGVANWLAKSAKR
jgi:glycosyltransferase involved in cell wall biosynthesis